MKNQNSFPYLMFCSLGNGISVCDKREQEFGDYKRVAHISPYREVKFYCELSEADANHIREFAKNEEPMVSTSQQSPVFWGCN